MAEDNDSKRRPARRRCSQCHKTKLKTEFSPNRYKSSGVQCYCRECARKHRSPRQTKEVRLRKYGLTIDEFEAMVADQGGACAICGAHDRLNVDHCHTTGRVRGLLCSPCNQGIGFLRDDANRMRMAAGYLERDGRRAKAA